MPPNNKVTFCGMLKYEAKQFCLNTALHGYRFIVLPKRILLERVFWVIIVVVSWVTAVTLLCIAWNTFQLKPTLLVTDSTHHPIWNYPFPAVTICSYNKISKHEAYKLARELNSNKDQFSNRTIEEQALQLKLLVQLIFNNNRDIPSRNYTKLQDILESNDETIGKVLRYLAPDCSRLLKMCKWKGEVKSCYKMFKQIPTSEGFCCSFNYHALKKHTDPESLVNNNINKHPSRLSACGHLTAMEVQVESYPNDYFATLIPSLGHRVLIHNSYDFPDWSIQSMMVEKQTINLIGISPTIMYSTESIRSMDVEKRNCLFPDERMLHNFVQYSFHNCLSECRMNVSLRLCGCIQFFYDNSEGTYPKRKICTLRDVGCLTENRHMIISSVPGYDVLSVKSYHRLGTGHNTCGCLPDCEYVSYLAESSSGVFTIDYSDDNGDYQTNLFAGINMENVSVIQVYFNDLMATRNRKDVSSSWHILLAYYGGLLGLFTGFTFVSVVELVYFFTIRLVSDSSKKRKMIKKKEDNRQKVIRVKPPPSYHDLNAGNLLRVDDYGLKLRQRNHSDS